MNRREVLKAGLVLPASVLTGSVRGERKILLLESVLAGFRYYEGEKVWNILRKGDPLELRREPDNPYDPRAVEVLWKGRKLGYVPRRDNAVIAQLMDRGNLLKGKISKLRETSNPWHRVSIEIYLVIVADL